MDLIPSTILVILPENTWTAKSDLRQQMREGFGEEGIGGAEGRIGIRRCLMRRIAQR
jgi:hypothetical protein